jgi:SAM-dependent methyltransferase
MTETAPHVRRNREHWETNSAEYQAWNRAQLERWDRLGWGVWDLAEDDLRVLGDVAGKDMLEYGCGACQSGIRWAMRGARVTGLDLSSAQLRAGVANMETTEVRFPLVQADGEAIPFPDASFDVVVCDHGVTSFADPRRTVPEATRVLRPGGTFAFCMITPLAWITQDEDGKSTRELHKPYFGLHREDYDDPDWRTTEFQLTYGEWIALFRANSLKVEALLELRPPEGATSTYVDQADLPWSRDYPVDHIWKLRKDA